MGRVALSIAIFELSITVTSGLIIAADAQTPEPAVLTLSCDGTVKTNNGNGEGQREAINKVSVVVDFARQTVSFAGYVAPIQNVDGNAVSFGSGTDPAIGDIDRASGVMSVTAVKGNLATSYELFCKPPHAQTARRSPGTSAARK